MPEWDMNTQVIITNQKVMCLRQGVNVIGDGKILEIKVNASISIFTI